MKKQNIFKQYLLLLVVLMMALSLMSFTVVIDAGHGGHDTGAVGLKMKVQEKDLNLAVAKQLA
ncbi:MAG: N-acetylmuramoyl-L-alanine amidase, partial [Paludibacteraceae bacterium]|nr:N-acetylmuramoyl-L-alanine amidase [Paludibacteraceae bacterium]